MALGHLGQGKGLCVALVQAHPSQTGGYGAATTAGVYSRVKNPKRRKNTCDFAHLWAPCRVAQHRGCSVSWSNTIRAVNWSASLNR